MRIKEYQNARVGVEGAPEKDGQVEEVGDEDEVECGLLVVAHSAVSLAQLVGHLLVVRTHEVCGEHPAVLLRVGVLVVRELVGRPALHHFAQKGAASDHYR